MKRLRPCTISNYQPVIFVSLMLLAVFVFPGCGETLSKTDLLVQNPASQGNTALVEELRNEDVHWVGNYLGLIPRIEGSVAKQLLKLGPSVKHPLQRALSDPNKFAAAHVLLTQIEMKSIPLSASHYNGLQVDLNADGTINLHPEQINKLKAMWISVEGGT